MAIFWNMGAWFDDEPPAKEFGDWFEPKKIPLSDGSRISLGVSYSDFHDGVLVGVWPEGMSMGRPDSDYRLLGAPFEDEIEEWFYRNLMRAPHFRYAYVGGEAHDELMDPLEKLLEDEDGGLAGLVLETSIWVRFGQHEAYEPFSDRHYWIAKYDGWDADG